MEEIRARCLPLGLGEPSAILLAQELEADLILLDDLGARKLTQRLGMKAQGRIGLLEVCYRRGYVADLREAYGRMLRAGVYLDRNLLNRILISLDLAPL